LKKTHVYVYLTGLVCFLKVLPLLGTLELAKSTLLFKSLLRTAGGGPRFVYLSQSRVLGLGRTDGQMDRK